MDIVERIAHHIRSTRALVTFSTTCTAARAMCAGARVGVVVTERSIEAGLERWIRRRPHAIHAIRFERCKFALGVDDWMRDLHRVISVRYLYCRVDAEILHVLPADRLRHLQVHQMRCDGTVRLDRFRALETLSLTFAERSPAESCVVVVLGIPSTVTDLELRCVGPGGRHLRAASDFPPALRRLALDVPCTISLAGFAPGTVESVFVRCGAGAVSVLQEGRAYPALVDLTIDVPGIAATDVLDDAPNIRRARIVADAVIVGAALGRVRGTPEIRLESRRHFVDAARGAIRHLPSTVTLVWQGKPFNYWTWV